jgi:putative MATE family efflux protein
VPAAPDDAIDKIPFDEGVIVSGSTWQAIWFLTMPMLFNMVMMSLGSFADTVIAGHQDSSIQAAVGIAGQVSFLYSCLQLAVSTGVSAIVSRFWGAREYDQAVIASRYSLIVGSIFGLLSALFAFISARFMYQIMGASPTVCLEGERYMQVFSLSVIPMALIWINTSLFRSIGKAQLASSVWIIQVLLVIIFDVILCVYPWHLGIGGLAISLLISALSACLLSIYLMSNTELADCLKLNTITISDTIQWSNRLLKIGLPASVQDFAWVFGNFVMFSIFAKLSDPTSIQACWSIGLRIEETLGVMPIFALNMAIGTIVGQNLGARRAKRAQDATWQAVIIALIFGLVVGLILYFAPETIAKFMTTDKKVIAYVVDYLRINALALPFFGAWFVLFGALQGAGYTKLPMIVSIASLLLMKLPMAWWLSLNLGMGVTGCWIAQASNQLILSTLAAIIFKLGHWKKQKV